ncbi:ABC transporter permease [Paractinoplanes durhamensis]|uniref:ABC transporter permease n=1 Tax=Paractinoplanes durhamensis TaxID=113563 RepID=A0ABQ3Z4W0_9ACTN|nr:ABC transporter permease [Actinoplanes durhamensis]GIE04869.1 ABC transporter permease [Actinoplanes durhamensis]
MRAALHAEWTKLRTIPEAAVFLLLTVVLTVALSVTAAALGAVDRVEASLLGVRLGQAVVAAWAIQLLAGEFGTGLASTTFIALPRRLTVLTAKAVLLLTGVLAAAVVSVTASVLAGRILIDDYPPLTDGPLRAAAGSVGYLLLIALLGLGAGAALRSAVGATSIVLGLLYLTPVIIGMFSDLETQHHIFRAMPGTAGLTVLSTVDMGTLPIQPLPGLVVAATWAFVTLGVGAAVFCARDV